MCKQSIKKITLDQIRGKDILLKQKGIWFVSVVTIRTYTGHIDCSELKRKSSNKLISRIRNESELGKGFKPYLQTTEINSFEHQLLRNTGAGIDLCDRSWINNENLLGEVAWILQPSDNKSICLPLAKVSIKTDSCYYQSSHQPGNLQTGYYLLGNKTAELIEEQKRSSISNNAVMTHC